MTPEIIQAARQAIEASATPLSINQIATAVRKRVKAPAAKTFQAELAEVLGSEALRPGSGIFAWPTFKNSAQFCRRPLIEAVGESVLKVLDQGPLTPAKAAEAVRIERVSSKTIKEMMKDALREMARSGTVIQFWVTRQSAIYFSRNWMANQAETDRREDELGELIPQVIERLESAPGNYVRVDRLRTSPEIRGLFDRAVIRLAEKGEVVLGPYEGPRPVPADQEWVYVEDRRGNLFIGVALPRKGGV